MLYSLIVGAQDVIVFCALLALCYGTEWNTANFPNPQTEPLECGLGSSGFLCDPDGQFTVKDRLMIDHQLKTFANYTVCTCSDCRRLRGYTMAVAMVKKLDVDNMAPESRDSDEAMHKFTDSLRTKLWDYSECSNDLILGISIEDRVMYLSTGLITNKVLTDCMVDVVLEDSKKLMKESRYKDAIVMLIVNVRDILNKNNAKAIDVCGWSDAYIWHWWKILVVVVAVVTLISLFVWLVYKFVFSKRNAKPSAPILPPAYSP